MTPGELKSFLIANNFIFNSINGTWNKFEFSIPAKMAEDIALIEEYERIVWLADNGFLICMINEELYIVNGVIVETVGEFMQMPLQDIKKKYTEKMARHIN